MNPATLKEGESASPVATLFDPNSDLLNAEEWLMRLDYQVLAAQRGEGDERTASRLELVKKTICDLLPDVHDVKIHGPGGQGLGTAKRKTGVWFVTDFGEVRLSDVSLGYQTMLAWTVDLASRLFDRYPDAPDPLSQPALVLVDEIDLHLHPSWQRRLLPFLSERFPKTQFIVTAHSPLVVQGSEEAVVAVLRKEGDHVIIDNQPERVRTWRVDQLLTSDLFGLESARPRWVAELMDERTRLVGDGLTTEEARKRVAEIDAELGDLPTAETPEEQSTLDELRELAAILRAGAGEGDDSD